MEIEVLADADTVARRAAQLIATAACDAVAARGRFVFAVSGGRTPRMMLKMLAHENVPWRNVHFVQVDERIAPAGDTDRNLTHLRGGLQSHAPLRDDQIHAMPVEDTDLTAAAGRYAATLAEVAGLPPVLDLVHLGLGADGHTASLIPNDAVLDVVNTDVALTEPYQGRRRMTLTYPVINRARRILWVVTGEDKTAALARLCKGDKGIPAGRVRRDNAMLLADRDAVR